MDPVDQASPGKAEGGADGWVSWWRVCIIIIIQYNIIYIYIYSIIWYVYTLYWWSFYGVDLNCSCLFVLSFSRSLFLIYIYIHCMQNHHCCPSKPFWNAPALVSGKTCREPLSLGGHNPSFVQIFTQTNLWEYEDRPNIDQGDETIKTMSKWWPQQLSYLK